MASGSGGFAGPVCASSQVRAPLRPQSCPGQWLPSLGAAGRGDQEEAIRSHQLLLLALSLSPQEAFPWSSWPRGHRPGASVTQNTDDGEPPAWCPEPEDSWMGRVPLGPPGGGGAGVTSLPRRRGRGSAVTRSPALHRGQLSSHSGSVRHQVLGTRGWGRGRGGHKAAGRRGDQDPRPVPAPSRPHPVAETSQGNSREHPQQLLCSSLGSRSKTQVTVYPEPE